MGSKSGGSGEIRFAGYVEYAHKEIVDKHQADVLATSVFACMNTAFDQSPYTELTTVKAEDGFLGPGYVIGQFPSLFDMFGKFMAGLDVEQLWSQIYEATVTGPEVAAAVTAHSAILQDEIDTKITPALVAGYRNINAVMSSAFVGGRAIVADSKLKAISQFTSQLQIHMIDITQARWGDHLNWNKSVIQVYSDMMKLYYSAQFDAEGREMEFAIKDRLWNLSLFDYGRAIIAALNGAAAAKMGAEPSQAQKSVSLAMSGAGAGAMLGQQISPTGSGAAWGAGIGGVLGLAASFA